MSNPWLGVPLGDYEGHMQSPGVGQLAELSDLFREVLTMRSPQSVAILGIAGGNGLEHVETAVTKRVMGLDLNPDYLDEVRRRYRQLPGLELVAIDLAEEVVDLKPVELVHAALIFEHAGLDRCLENAVSLVAANGALSVVLQRPSEEQPDLGASPFSSMHRLRPHISLIRPEILRAKLQVQKFGLSSEALRSLPGGKAFWMGVFVRE